MGSDWGLPCASPDGRTVYADREVTATRRDIWTIPLVDPGRRSAWLATDAFESEPQVSPDGQWVAYVSDRSGTTEIYARRADGAGLVQLSVHGGDTPRWAADGRGLWYDAPDGKLHRVPVTEKGNELGAGPPERGSEIDSTNLQSYSVARDGRLLVLRNGSGSDAGFVVRVGWMERLK
jgi:Tol biopolymer transport system component